MCSKSIKRTISLALAITFLCSSVDISLAQDKLSPPLFSRTTQPEFTFRYLSLTIADALISADRLRLGEEGLTGLLKSRLSNSEYGNFDIAHIAVTKDYVDLPYRSKAYDSPHGEAVGRTLIVRYSIADEGGAPADSVKVIDLEPNAGGANAAARAVYFRVIDPNLVPGANPKLQVSPDASPPPSDIGPNGLPVGPGAMNITEPRENSDTGQSTANNGANNLTRRNFIGAGALAGLGSLAANPIPAIAGEELASSKVDKKAYLTYPEWQDIDKWSKAKRREMREAYSDEAKRQRAAFDLIYQFNNSGVCDFLNGKAAAFRKLKEEDVNRFENLKAGLIQEATSRKDFTRSLVCTKILGLLEDSDLFQEALKDVNRSYLKWLRPYDTPIWRDGLAAGYWRFLLLQSLGSFVKKRTIDDEKIPDIVRLTMAAWEEGETGLGYEMQEAARGIFKSLIDRHDSYEESRKTERILGKGFSSEFGAGSIGGKSPLQERIDKHDWIRGWIHNYVELAAPKRGKNTTGTDSSSNTQWITAGPGIAGASRMPIHHGAGMTALPGGEEEGAEPEASPREEKNVIQALAEGFGVSSAEIRNAFGPDDLDFRGLSSPGHLSIVIALMGRVLNKELRTEKIKQMITTIGEFLQPGDSFDTPDSVRKPYAQLYTSKNRKEFIQRLDVYLKAMENYLRYSPPTDEWHINFKQLINGPEFTLEQKTLLRKTAERVVRAFYPDDVDDEIVRREVNSLYQATLPMSLEAFFHYFPIPGEEDFNEEFSGRGGYFEKLGFFVVTSYISKAFVLMKDAIVLPTLPEKMGSTPGLAMLAAHEYAHRLIDMHGSCIWRGTVPYGSGHQDWVTTAIEVIIQERVSAEREEPMSWYGVGLAMPSVTRWAYQEGQRIAGLPSSEQTRVLNSLNFDADTRFYLQGFVVGGMAREIGRQIAAGRPEEEQFKAALHLIGSWARYEFVKAGGPPRLEDFISTAEHINIVNSVPGAAPGAKIIPTHHDAGMLEMTPLVMGEQDGADILTRKPVPESLEGVKEGAYVWRGGIVGNVVESGKIGSDTYIGIKIPGQSGITKFYIRASQQLKTPVCFATAEDAVALEAMWGERFADTVKVQALDAKKKGEHLIIGLETNGWIPAEQGGAIQPLISEISRIGEHLNRLGLDNVRIVRGSGDGLADEVKRQQKEDRANLNNIVILATEKTLRSNAFDDLRSTETEERAFLAAMAPDAIKEFCYIRLLEMLMIAMRMSSGQVVKPDEHPNIAIESIGRRMIRLIPKAEPKDYQELNRTYEGQKQSLAAV